MKDPLISIVIPVYNEEKDIPHALNSLKNQSYKNKEIIIVDDGSKDGTLREVKKFPKVKIIKGQHKGPGFSRNLGAKEAKGEILVFVDADMTFEKEYLKNLVEPLKKDKKLIGTTHNYEVVENTSNIWSRCWGRVRVSKEESKDVKIFRAIRKKKFLDLGSFDPKYGYADDQTFWFKHKVKPKVIEATCYHKNPETLKAVYRQSRWIGASLDNKLFRSNILKPLVFALLVLSTPFSIVLLALKRSFRNNDFSILIPWMVIFAGARFTGTLAGIYRKNFRNLNVR